MEQPTAAIDTADTDNAKEVAVLIPKDVLADVKDKNDSESSTLSRMMKMLAAPVGLFTGGVFAHAKVRDDSYNSLRNKGLFSDLKAERDKEVKPLLYPLAEKHDIAAELRKIDSAHSKLIDERIINKGYTNMAKRFSALHRNQKFEALLTGVTVGALFSGAMFAIADHKHLLSELSGKDDQSPSK